MACRPRLHLPSIPYKHHANNVCLVANEVSKKRTIWYYPKQGIIDVFLSFSKGNLSTKIEFLKTTTFLRSVTNILLERMENSLPEL